MTRAHMGDLRRIGALLAAGRVQDVRDHVRARIAEERWRRSDPPDQLVLRAMIRDLPVLGCRLDCGITGKECVARILADEKEIGKGSAKKGSSRAKRGTASAYVVCRHCDTGKRVRALLGDDPEAEALARRANNARDMGGTRPDHMAQIEARQRQALVTVEAPTIDSNLGEE